MLKKKKKHKYKERILRYVKCQREEMITYKKKPVKIFKAKIKCLKTSKEKKEKKKKKKKN